MFDIQGAASKTGQAICQALASEGAGVILTDLNSQGTQETLDSWPKHVSLRHKSYTLNVMSDEDVSKVSENIISVSKRPPCISVGCAGIISDECLLDLDEEKLDNISFNVLVLLLIHEGTNIAKDPLLRSKLGIYNS